METLTKSMKLDLPVPYYSQKEEEVMLKYGRKGCVLTALRMVLAYYGRVINFEQLCDKANQIGAYTEEQGWIHSGLVTIARDFGLKGFRINFSQLNDQDLDNVGPILANEGSSSEEIKEFKKNFYFAKEQGRLAVIDQFLEEKIPVIASMEKSYSNTLATHAVVIKGLEDDKYILNDPWDFGQNYSIEKSKFDEGWTKRAIIIYK